MTNGTLDNFIIPKKPAKRSRPESVSPISTTNTFQQLKEITLPSISKTIKIPPIYMTATTHNKNLTTIQKYTKTFNLTYCGNGQVRVQTRTLEDFHKLKDGLKTDNEEFYSFTLKSDKPKKSVIRGLPVLDIQEIHNDLTEKEFKIISIFKLKGKDGLPTKTPLYLIHFDPCTDTNKIKQITDVCHCKIKIEKYTTNKNITQCFRCQQFGHAASNCNKQFKCVKCAGDHETASCIKEADAPAKCCNCGGSHTANFNQCPAKMTYKTKTARTPPKPLLKPLPQLITLSPSNATPKTTIQNGFSWAQITKGPVSSTIPSIPTTTSEPPTTDSKKTTTSAEMPINDLLELVLKVRKLQIKLKSCGTEQERFQLIWELASTMEDV